MKLGKINKDTMPITQVRNITAPIQIEYRSGDGLSIKTLLIGGQPFDCFRGLINGIEARQDEIDQKRKAIDF